MPNSPYQEQAGLEQLIPADQATSSTQTDTVPSLRRTLSQLPRRYLNALVKPSVATYTADKGDASWSLVWIQLVAWAILDATLGLLVNFIYPPATGTTFSRLFSLANIHRFDRCSAHAVLSVNGHSLPSRKSLWRPGDIS